MYRTIGIGITAVVIVLAGCATPSRPKEPAVALTEAEAALMATYRAAGRELVIDELQSAPAATFAIDPYTQAHEGCRIIRLLGLVDRLSVAEQYAFIDALFRDLSNPVAFAEPVRNIVVGQWYTNGEPLIVHVTQAFSGDRIPSVGALFNTGEGIRERRYEAMQEQGPAVEYPRLVRDDSGLRMIARELYAIKLLENGQVSASGAVGRDLPDFATIEDVRMRVKGFSIDEAFD